MIMINECVVIFYSLQTSFKAFLQRFVVKEFVGMNLYVCN